MTTKPHQATFRFYEELNDFLAPDQRGTSINYAFNNHPSIKDAIEAIGVPHTEVDLILVNSRSVGFDYQLQHDDQVSVYPTFEGFDISTINHLRPAPLRNPKFILDVHLGKLAKFMRMLGLDSYYENNLEDRTIIDIAQKEHRIILTRDRGILKHKSVTHGYYVHSDQVQTQLTEVLKRFDLNEKIHLFSRCLECNHKLRPIEKNKIIDQLGEETKKLYNTFYYCDTCQKIYWPGSHYDHMLDTLAHILPQAKKIRFSYFDHESDIGICGKGKTLEEAFIAAAAAVFSIMCDLATIRSIQQLDFEFDESDPELALVTWLNQLIGRARSEGLMLSKFALTHQNGRWHGSAWGEPWQNEMTHGVEVKGATLSQLKVKEEKGHWVAQCIVDV